MSVSTSVVSLAISVGTRSAQQAGFGTPAIFANAPYVGGKQYELSTEGLAAMVTDGFTVNDRGYLLASSMASQSPHADQVVVFNRAALSTNTLEFTPLVTTVGTVYSFDITYKNVTSSISYTVVTGTVDAIIDGIEALIDASPAGLAGITTTPDNATATKLSLIGATTGEPVQISGANPRLIKLLDVTTDAGIATDLAACAVDFEFYDFVIDTYSEAENNAAAVWAEANKKLFTAQSADSTNIVDSAGTGVGHDFFAALYNYSMVAHSGDMKGNMGACLASRQAALNPGDSSAAFKTLSGPAADALTATHLTNASGKNVCVYGLDGGTSHTFFGKMASGRSQRVQRSLDLVDARVREAILAVFLSNEYVPMSDSGFAQMEGAVRSTLAGFQRKADGSGFIEPGSITVTVPKVSSISAANLTAGIMPDLKFGYICPPDMLRVVVKGNVSFS